MIEFKKARRSKGGSRVWESRDGRYKITACEMVYGVKITPVYFTAWAMVKVKDLHGLIDSERRISRHRSKQAAAAACAKFERGRNGKSNTRIERPLRKGDVGRNGSRDQRHRGTDKVPHATVRTAGTRRSRSNPKVAKANREVPGDPA